MDSVDSGLGHRPNAVDTVDGEVFWGTYGETIEISRLQRGFGHLAAQRLVFQGLVQVMRVLRVSVVRGVVMDGVRWMWW